MDIEKQYPLAERVIAARAKRFNTTPEDLTMESGWQYVARLELNEARDRLQDPFLGGEDAVAAIEAFAATEVKP